jgi:lysophospholipase L1-like esterase
MTLWRSPKKAAHAMTNQRRYTGIIKKVCLAVGSLLLFLTVLELLLRLLTTGQIYLSEHNPHFIDHNGWIRLTPSQQTWWYGCHYSVNSNGFRMTHEVDPTRRIRVVALGDSITLGMGVRETSAVWPSQLETLIHRDISPSVEVINTGVQGWNLMTQRLDSALAPAEFTAYVNDLRTVLGFDAVVYCVCLNDVPSRVQELFVEDNSRNKKRFTFFPERMREWFKRKAVYRLARDWYREKKFRELDFSGIPTPPRSVAFWNAVSDELAALKSACHQGGARLYVVIVPYSYEFLPGNRDLLAINQQWQMICRSNDIPCVDISIHFDENNVLDYFALGDYIHPNAKGHSLIAQEALGLIRQDLKELVISKASNDHHLTGDQRRSTVVSSGN